MEIYRRFFITISYKNIFEGRLNPRITPWNGLFGIVFLLVRVIKILTMTQIIFLVYANVELTSKSNFPPLIARIVTFLSWIIESRHLRNWTPIDGIALSAMKKLATALRYLPYKLWVTTDDRINLMIDGCALRLSRRTGNRYGISLPPLVEMTLLV